MKRIIWTNSSFSLLELIQNGRLLTLPLAAGDLHSLLPDEDGRHLYVAMKDNLLSTSLDDITQNPRKVRAGEQTLSRPAVLRIYLINSFHTDDWSCSLCVFELRCRWEADSEFVLKKRSDKLSSRSCLLLFMGTLIHPAKILAHKE